MLLESIFYAYAAKQIKREFASQLGNFKMSVYFNEYSEQYSKIKEVLSRTKYWHGTGAFLYDHVQDSKYNSTSESVAVMNVLQNIIDQNGILPMHDPFIYFAKGSGIDCITKTINGDVRKYVSFANYRLYALSYAVTKNYTFDNFILKISSDIDFWYKLVVLNQIVKYKRFVFIFIYNLARKTKLGEVVRKWTSSYILDWNKNLSMGDLLKQTTDIEDNYGVVIGVSEKFRENIVTTIGNTESRSMQRVPLEYFTYIEVPYSKVNEAREICKNTPVFATEFIDYYYLSNGIVREIFTIK